jgi:hypothetical protein
MISRPPSAKYTARAQAFAEAIDIGISLFVPMSEGERRNLASPPSPEEEIAQMTTEWSRYKADALTPEPAFATVRSLAYLEEAYLTYWNEAAGGHVERFWQAVAERALPYKRRDILREVLNRGRIGSEAEYETVTDSLAVQQQLGMISAEEAIKLNEFLGQYEERLNARKGQRRR